MGITGERGGGDAARFKEGPGADSVGVPSEAGSRLGGGSEGESGGESVWIPADDREGDPVCVPEHTNWGNEGGEDRKSVV